MMPFHPESHPMVRLSRVLSAFLLLTLCVGLARAQAPATLYYPVVVGATWTYRAGDNRFQIKVAEVKDVAGVTRAKLDLIVGDKVISHEHVGVAKDGVYRYTFEGKEAKPPIKFLELPVKKDATWSVDSKVEGQALTGSFKSGEEDVKVPAGEYKKAVTVTGKDIKANGVPLGITYYFAEKVGMVKQVIDLAGQKVVIELENFEVPKQK
jgi:hypothetical protein